MARTDAEGAYQLRLRPGRYGLLADADGYAPERKSVELLNEVQQDFRLNPAGRISGRVLEKSTGTPVEAALVRATVEGRFATKETTSDSSGNFAFANLDPAGTWSPRPKGGSRALPPIPRPWRWLRPSAMSSPPSSQRLRFLGNGAR